jgi:hypothetical protein
MLDPGGSGKYLPVGDGPYKDTNGAGGIKRSDATGADLGNSRFGPPAVGFSSIGHAKGAFHKNISDNVIEDVHIKLLGADTVDPASIGGSAFPMVMISADMKEVWFSGGNIMKNDMIWSMFPKFGAGVAQGYLTAPKPKPPEKKQEGLKCTGSNSSNSSYDSSTQTIQLQGGSTNFAKYSDGTNGNLSDAIIGTNISVQPMHIVGPSPDVPGAMQLSDSDISFSLGSTTYLTAGLTDALVYPDFSVPGFDSVVQASLYWSQGDLTLGSRILSEFYPNDGVGQNEIVLFYRSNLLSQTAQLTRSGSALGMLAVSNAVPEPAAVALILAGAAALIGAPRRRREA